MKKQFTNKARYLGLKLTAIIFALLLISGQSWGANIIPTHTGTIASFGTWSHTSCTQAAASSNDYIKMVAASSKVVTPTMDFSSYTAMKLDFKAGTFGTVTGGKATITVSISTNNGLNWTSLGTRLPASSTILAMTQFDISSYTGSQVLIKIETLSADGSNGVRLDDISITGTSSNPSITTGTITGFGNVAVNTTSSEKSYTVSGSNLTDNITITPPSGFEISTGTGASFVATSPITLTQSGGSVASTTIYVRFKPTAIQAYSGNISHTTTSGNNPDVAVSGTGIAPSNPATFTATASTSTQINLSATANTNGNNIVVIYNSSGTFTTPTDGVAAGNVGDAFASGTIIYKGSAASITNHTGLTPSTAYYYKAFSYDASNFYSSGSTANATTNGIDAPVATAATNLTSTGFTANWNSVSGATSYRLDISSVSDFGLSVMLSENFTGFTTNNGTTDRSSALDTYLQTTGWTGTNIYEMIGYAKLGSTNNKGSITTKTINLSANSGNATLTFDLSKYGTDATIVQVFHASDGTTFSQIGSDITAPASMTTQTISITGGTVNSKIMIAAKNASSNRFYLDNIIIKQENSAAILTGYNDLTVNATNQAISGLSSNTSYYYRVRAFSSSGTSINSNTITVTTSFPTEPTNHATTFTATANSTTAITTTWADNDGAQAATGYLVMMNTSNSFTNPVDAVAQNDGANVKNVAHGIQTIQWTGLTAGTQYFFKIFPYTGSGSSINYKTDGTAPTSNTYTNSTTVTINSTTNWTSLSNVGTGTDVTIPNGVELTVNANASCSGITIQNGGKLTINTSTTLSTSAVLIEEGGSLIDNGGNTLPALADKTIAGNASGSLWQWHFLSSPVVNQPITGTGNFIDFGNNPANVDFYKYDPSATTQSWINIKDGNGVLNTADWGSSPVFEIGRGYLVSYNSTSTSKTFDGNLNTGDANITLVANKFNLIGNPFPSAINWVGASYANLGSNSVWIYNENKSGGAGYEIFTSGTIAPMQGFFIKSATATTITLANSIRTHNSSTFYKNSTLSFNEFILKFSNGNNWDVSNIQFMNNASANEDRNDALKLFSMNTAIPQVYTTISTGQKFAVNALPELNANTTVPVGIYVPANGNYTISADGLANFSHCTSITLEDLKTNTTQNLMQNPVYSFTAATTDNANRFVLHFATAVGVNEIGNSNGGIYAYDNNIYVNTNGQIKQICVYNAMGQLVNTLSNVNGLQKINMNGNATGYYIVRVVSDKNVYSEKVLVK